MGQSPKNTIEGIRIRPCGDADFSRMLEVINDGAEAYRTVIPADRWHEPYMSANDLRRELSAGVSFVGAELRGGLIGVMGVQRVKDVTLIRHAYVVTAAQGKGVGGLLMRHLESAHPGQMLVGTWSDARWAIAFYQRHGFRLTDPARGRQLL